MTTYQLNLSIAQSDPKIWRMVEVPSTFSLASMHRLIQIVMNWDDYHLHEFVANKKHYGNKFMLENDWTEIILYDDITIADLLLRKRSKMQYNYDFGDDWQVDIVVEKISPADEATKPQCIGGEMAAPMEDCGGIWGYSEIVQGLKDKREGLKNEKTEWIDDLEFENFDPAEFDIAKINKLITKAKFSPAKKSKVKPAKKSDDFSPQQAMNDLARLSQFLGSQNFETKEELDKFMNEQVMGKRIDEIIPAKRGRKSNIENSDELIYTAMESSPAKAKKLIKQALEFNPENVRALCLLADLADTGDEAKPMYAKAMNIARKQLGDEFFEDNKGYFWGMHETRPYMTAKMGYADCLSSKGEAKEAIEQYQEILELNPHDNQGVRYILSILLLETKQYEDFLKLHKEFDEKSTFWLFNFALYLFAMNGITPASKKALKAANKVNKHVLAILTQQEEEFMDSGQDFYSPGDQNEAVYYLAATLGTWLSLDNTPDWIASVMLK